MVLSKCRSGAPPTPPQDENDLYIDHTLGFLYEQSVMPESQLPPIYIPKESNKRLRLDPTSIARKQKIRKEEGFNIPRSMFDVRPSNILLKVRRELVLQKLKISMLGWAEGAAIHKTLNAIGANSMPSYAQVHKPPQLYVAGVPYESLPSWGIHEDWAILHVLQYHQDLPLNLLILSPAHTPNWDLVSDIVNTVSSNYRSPKLCKYHYEVSIVPREEGKVSYEAAPKQKQKKKKDLTATPIAATQTPTSSAATSTTSSTAPNAPAIRVLKTSQLFMQDNNLTFSILNNKRFETIKMIANKRTPTSKNMFINPTGKNPKHIALLSENSINYDQPLQPMQVAFNRAERIAREKQKNLEQQQLAQARQQLVKQQQIKAILQQNPANINVPAVSQQHPQLAQVINARANAALSKAPNTGQSINISSAPTNVTVSQLANLAKGISQNVTQVQSANQQQQHTLQQTQPMIAQIGNVVTSMPSTSGQSVNQSSIISESAPQAITLTQHPSGSVVSVASGVGNPKLIAPSMTQVGQLTPQRLSTQTQAQQHVYKQLIYNRQHQQPQQYQIQRPQQLQQVQQIVKQQQGANITLVQQAASPQRFQLASPQTQSLIAVSGNLKAVATSGSNMPVSLPIMSNQRIVAANSPANTNIQAQQSVQQSLMTTSGMRAMAPNVAVSSSNTLHLQAATQSPRILTATTSLSLPQQQSIQQQTQSLIAGLKSSPSGVSASSLPGSTQRILTTAGSQPGKPQIITRTLDKNQIAHIMKQQALLSQHQQGNLSTQILHLQQPSAQQTQQQQSQQLLQNQSVILVKTLPPSSSNTMATQLTIPVSAVTMAGVNFIPTQATKVMAQTSSVTTIATSSPSPQMRQIHLLQKRTTNQPQQVVQQQQLQQALNQTRPPTTSTPKTPNTPNTPTTSENKQNK